MKRSELIPFLDFIIFCMADVVDDGTAAIAIVLIAVIVVVLFLISILVKICFIVFRIYKCNM